MAKSDQLQAEQNVKFSFARCDLFQMLIGIKKKFNHATNMIDVLEVLLSQKLMRVCDQNKQEYDIQESASILHNLGKIYRKKVQENYLW